MLLQQITLRNLLSFKGATIDLKPLNILIGENTAGKSNLIEAISLLQAAPSDFLNTIPRGGGVAYWLWMGGGVQAPSAGLSCLVKLSKHDLRYELEFSAEGGMLSIRREGLFDASGKAHFKRIKEFVDIGENLHGPAGTVQSVFALYKNPADPTPITLLASLRGRTRIIRAAAFDAYVGRNIESFCASLPSSWILTQRRWSVSRNRSRGCTPMRSRLWLKHCGKPQRECN